MLMAVIVDPFATKGDSPKTPIKDTFNSARPTLLRSFEFKHLTADFMPEELLWFFFFHF